MTATQPQGADKKGDYYWLILPAGFLGFFLLIYGIPVLDWLYQKEIAWLKIH